MWLRLKTATNASRERTSVTVKLADDRGVKLVSPVAMSDIKDNSFLGVASLRSPDGTLNALELLVFAEAARGSNEVHFPWDLQPESMMTNATVATVAASSDGQMLTLEYKDGTQTLKMKPGTPIVAFAPGNRADAEVFAGAAKGGRGWLVDGDAVTGWQGRPDAGDVVVS